MARRDIISISIDPELNENINKYMASQRFKHSKSYYIEQAIKMYLNQDEQVLSRLIENSIKSNIKAFEDRYCRILAKLAKRTYANTEILLRFMTWQLALGNTKESQQFLEETLREAEKVGYKALTDGLIERTDFETLFPKEFKNR